MKKFIAALLLSTTATLCAGDLYLIAHRGEYLALKQDPETKKWVSTDYAPEGTMPTYKRVRDQKINAVKLDVQYTADDEVVISHDLTLKRTTGQDLRVTETTYAELKKAVFIKRGEFADERIVTLNEVLPIVKDCERFYLDFKAYKPDMMDKVFKSFDAHGIPRERILIATFNKEALRGAKAAYPDVRRVLHFSYPERKDGKFVVDGKVTDFEAVKAQMYALREELGLYGFNIPTRSTFTTPEFVRELKAKGLWVSLWFVVSTEVADRFRDSGADGFVTGMPSSIRAWLKGELQKP
jgi:glycerophosphoryl diester phosphodiesterase